MTEIEQIQLSVGVLFVFIGIWSSAYPWHSPYVKKCLRCNKHIFKPPPLHPMCKCRCTLYAKVLQESNPGLLVDPYIGD